MNNHKMTVVCKVDMQSEYFLWIIICTCELGKHAQKLVIVVCSTPV